MKTYSKIVLSCLLTGGILFGSPGLTRAQEKAAATVETCSTAHELAKLMLPKDALQAMTDTMAESMLSAPGSGNLSAEKKKEVRDEIKSTMDALKSVLTDEVLVDAVAEIYNRHFDDKELKDLIAFYKTETGQKLVAKQGAITAEMSEATIHLIQENQALLTMEETIASQQKNFIASVLEEYNQAVKAEPFPNQDALLPGKWNGKYKDDEMETVWNYERRKDGTVTLDTVSLMTADKEFEQTKDKYLWKAKGRVLFETLASDPGWVDIYILDGVTKEKITYRNLIEDIDPSDWETETDLPGSAELPKIPKGWKDISEQ